MFRLINTLSFLLMWLIADAVVLFICSSSSPHSASIWGIFEIRTKAARKGLAFEIQ
jgi:hypothetical protein